MTFSSNSPAFLAGQEHADLFLGFSCFLFDTCQQRGIEDLFFCTREGVFFKTVFDAIFNRDPASPAIRTHLLEVSRLSVFPATVLVEGGIDFSGLFRLYKMQSPSTLLKSLGLEPKHYNDLFLKYDLDPNRLESEVDFMKRLNTFLADPSFIERTIPKLQEQKSRALGYLSQRFGASQRIGLVDIGWRGTIQNSIATLLPDRQFTGLYLGLAQERNIMQPNCEKIALGPNQNLSREFVGLLHAVNVLEFVCLSTGGSASSYAQNEKGSYQVRKRISALENREIEAFSIPFQQGVISVAQNANLQALNASHQKGDLRTKAMWQWQNLIRKPPQELVDAYFALKSNEVFGLGIMANQAATPSLWHILSAPFSVTRRHQLLRFLTYSQWAYGYKRRTDLTLHSRWGLFGLMKAAEKYKHMKVRRQKHPARV